ncbi:MAG: peptidase S8 and S53 subtilisin kexin [Planctomycetota bacterium]|nr:MAG: peptidase S8 and S53 subtilisin kexin [Planctomycetota bacterium]
MSEAAHPSATGKNVRVLIVDSGVETSHPVFDGRRIRCWNFRRAAPVEERRGIDVLGHGTAVAAILCAFAPGARIESLRVLGGDLRASSSAVLSGLQWALDQRYDIINCSFGTPAAHHLEAYKRFVDRAFCRNVLVVSACNNFDFRKEEFPACFPTVISTDFGRLQGLTIRRRRNQLVEFVCRGVSIEVAWKGGSWRQATGSSFAAPHLAALVARIREVHPGWNACEMKAELYRMATKNGDSR